MSRQPSHAIVDSVLHSTFNWTLPGLHPCSHIKAAHTILTKSAARLTQLSFDRSAQAELVGEVHRRGLIQQEAFSADGTLLQARVPKALAGRLQQWQLGHEQFHDLSVKAQELTAVGAGT